MKCLSWRLEFERKLSEGTEENTIIGRAIDEIAPDLKVRHGIFQGMVYPGRSSVSSALFPKLLGSYEHEIHEVLETLVQIQYDNIIDIGCAEGYYAVGMALRVPKATIHAFDSNPDALKLCEKLAQANHVADRLKLFGGCRAEDLISISSSGRTLIICDCDSCERSLFSENVVSHLKQCDLLVETHDCYDMDITTVMRQRFGKSHDIKVVDSIPDIKKVHTYAYPELANYDLNTRLILLGERPHHQEWFFMTPNLKKGDSGNISLG